MNPIEQTALAQQNIYRAALSSHPAQRRLEAVLRAYDAALRDPEAKIPTPLHMALEAARLA